MPSRKLLLSALATAFLAGDANADESVERGSRILGRRWRWLRPLARRFVEEFSGQVRPRHKDVVQFLSHDPGFQRAWLAHRAELRIAQCSSGTQQMRPVAAAAAWKIPRLESVRALAEWLRISESELEWFADLNPTSAVCAVSLVLSTRIG